MDKPIPFFSVHLDRSIVFQDTDNEIPELGVR